jgi:hypothetical protein
VAYDLADQCLDESASGAQGSAVPIVDYLLMFELKGFRRDPRFQALATRLGLMDYWQQYGPPDDCDLKDGKLTCH